MPTHGQHAVRYHGAKQVVHDLSIAFGVPEGSIVTSVRGSRRAVLRLRVPGLRVVRFGRLRGRRRRLRMPRLGRCRNGRRSGGHGPYSTLRRCASERLRNGRVRLREHVRHAVMARSGVGVSVIRNSPQSGDKNSGRPRQRTVLADS
jgi:hypothetical protein